MWGVVVAVPLGYIGCFVYLSTFATTTPAPYCKISEDDFYPLKNPMKRLIGKSTDKN
jgi:hypothetical protein